MPRLRGVEKMYLNTKIVKVSGGQHASCLCLKGIPGFLVSLHGFHCKGGRGNERHMIYDFQAERGPVCFCECQYDVSVPGGQEQAFAASVSKSVSYLFIDVG